MPSKLRSMPLRQPSPRGTAMKVMREEGQAAQRCVDIEPLTARKSEVSGALMNAGRERLTAVVGEAAFVRRAQSPTQAVEITARRSDAQTSIVRSARGRARRERAPRNERSRGLGQALAAHFTTGVNTAHGKLMSKTSSPS